MVLHHDALVAPQHATHAFIALACGHLTRTETEKLYQRLVGEIGESETQQVDARTALKRMLKLIRTSTGTALSRCEALSLAEQAALDVAETRRGQGHG